MEGRVLSKINAANGTVAFKMMLASNSMFAVFQAQFLAMPKDTCASCHHQSHECTECFAWYQLARSQQDTGFITCRFKSLMFTQRQLHAPASATGVPTATFSSFASKSATFGIPELVTTRDETIDIGNLPECGGTGCCNAP